jgi:hypothetical protein
LTLFKQSFTEIALNHKFWSYILQAEGEQASAITNHKLVKQAEQILLDIAQGINNKTIVVSTLEQFSNSDCKLGISLLELVDGPGIVDKLKYQLIHLILFFFT